MYISTVGRERFLSWITGGGKVVGKTVPDSAVSGLVMHSQLSLLWPNKLAVDGANAPLVCLPEREINDFFAFTSTYIGAISPFSAFYRVISAERLSKLLEGAKTQPLLNLASLTGAAMAEAFLQSRGRTTLNDLTVAGVLGTLSASLAAGVHNGYDEDGLERIAAGWVRSRTAANADAVALSASAILSVWSIVAMSSRNSPARSGPADVDALIAQLLRRCVEAGDFTPDLIRPAFSAVPDMDRVFARMTASREERVKALGDGLDILLRSGAEGVLLDFLAGALLSMVGNGSFDFLPLTTRFPVERSAATIWFGICSGLHRATDVFSISSCLGRRSARDMFANIDLFSPPKDDICIEEFEVLRRGRGEFPSFRTSSQSVISIEVLPGVSVKVRNSQLRGESASESASQALPVRRLKDSEEMRELRYLLDRARHTVERLAASSDQIGLFDREEPSTKRRR